MGQDHYIREQAYKEAEAKYQAQMLQRDEEIRRLREELARKG
jgi:hypothetical protein